MAFAVLIGCATKSQTGAVIGAGTGAAVGKILGGDRGAIVGGIVGGAIGYGIGRHLDQQDQQRLAEARRRALESNARQRFYAASVQSDVVVEPTRSYKEARLQLMLDNDVEPRMVTIVKPVPVLAAADVPVYRAPNYAYAPKLLLAQGTSVTPIATVDASDGWVLVGKGDFGVGYVNRNYLKAAESATATGSVAAAKPAPQGLPAGTPEAPAKTPPRRTAAARTPAPASDRTQALLGSSETFLPPAKHLAGSTTTPTDFQRVSYQGEEKARAARSGDARAKAAVKPVKANVECRDLTTTLLSDKKEVSRETGSACTGFNGEWS